MTSKVRWRPLKARNVEIAYGPFKASAQTKRPNVILKDDDGNLIQLFGKEQ